VQHISVTNTGYKQINDYKSPNINDKLEDDSLEIDLNQMVLIANPDPSHDT
jgi:hypothetical protein